MDKTYYCRPVPKKGFNTNPPTNNSIAHNEWVAANISWIKSTLWLGVRLVQCRLLWACYIIFTRAGCDRLAEWMNALNWRQTLYYDVTVKCMFSIVHKWHNMHLCWEKQTKCGQRKKKLEKPSCFFLYVSAYSICVTVLNYEKWSPEFLLLI